MILNPFLVDHSAAVCELGVFGPFNGHLHQIFDAACSAQRHSLVVELVGDETPAFVHSAHDVGLGDAHIVVEGGGGVGRAEGGEGLDGEAGIVRRHEEHGDALVGWAVWVGAGGKPDVVGVPSQAGEELFAR